MDGEGRGIPAQYGGENAGLCVISDRKAEVADLSPAEVMSPPPSISDPADDLISSQDLQASQGAADGSVDMDRLNRNLPENGRPTRQVLQVSEELFVPSRRPVSSLDLFSQLGSWNMNVLLLL